IANNARNFVPGIQFGATGAGTQPIEGDIYNNNNLILGNISQTITVTAGVASNPTGKITNASNIVKQGAGNMFIDTDQPNFSGNYAVNQGGLFFRNNLIALPNLGGSATPAQTQANTNGIVILSGNGTQFGLRSDVSTITGLTYFAGVNSST